MEGVEIMVVCDPINLESPDPSCVSAPASATFVADTNFSLHISLATPSNNPQSIEEQTRLGGFRWA